MSLMLLVLISKSSRVETRRYLLFVRARHTNPSAPIKHKPAQIKNVG